MAGITLDGVRKVYDGGVQAVRDVSLEIGDGEFLVLVGPSGCGKTTLLRMIAGLEQVTSGTIRLGNVDVTDLEPQRRDVAMVFQNYALYPHMTVAKNLAFGLRIRRTAKDQIESRIQSAATILGLGELMDRKPPALSGGQRQRVAMGRAIVREPQAFLMDEPLSNLDAKLRVSMRAELTRLHARLGVTTIYVTHDQAEAMTLGQRVAILRDGVLQQCDTPDAVFDDPVNLFVAAFIGSPAMNLVQIEIAGGTARFGGLEVALPDDVDDHLNGRRVVLGVRPSDFTLAGPRSDPSWPRISVRPTVVERLGSECHLVFAVDAPPVVTAATQAAIDDDGGGQLIADEKQLMFTARVEGRARVRPGDHVELAIDRERIYLFDPDTGAIVRGASPSEDGRRSVPLTTVDD
jgi:multiple sugar transport system ATP-binding protein